MSRSSRVTSRFRDEFRDETQRIAPKRSTRPQASKLVRIGQDAGNLLAYTGSDYICRTFLKGVAVPVFQHRCMPDLITFARCTTHVWIKRPGTKALGVQVSAKHLSLQINTLTRTDLQRVSKPITPTV